MFIFIFIKIHQYIGKELLLATSNLLLIKSVAKSRSNGDIIRTVSYGQAPREKYEISNTVLSKFLTSKANELITSAILLLSPPIITL